MKLRRNLVALTLCAFLFAILGGIYLYEKNRQRFDNAVYQQVIPEFEKQQQEIQKLKEERIARREQARENYNAAAQAYLPGIAFFGDSLVSDTNGQGMDFRSTISSLVRSSVCSTTTAYINTLAKVDYSSVESFLPVIFMGDNNTPLGDMDALLSKQAEYIGDHDRYIVVGPTRGTGEEMAYFEAVMTQTYGDRFVNIREYMSTNGLASLELEITNADRAAMNEGRIPPSFLKSDGIHLNDNGTRLLSYLTFERMTDLGYFDEITAAKQLYSEAEEDAR